MDEEDRYPIIINRGKMFVLVDIYERLPLLQRRIIHTVPSQTAIVHEPPTESYHKSPLKNE